MCAYFPPGYTSKRIPRRVIGANAFGAVVDVYTCGELGVLSLGHRLKTVDVSFLVYFFGAFSTGTLTRSPLPWREACMTYTLRSTHSLHLSALRSFLCLFCIRSNRRAPSSFRRGGIPMEIYRNIVKVGTTHSKSQQFCSPKRRNPDQILPDESSLLPMPPPVDKKQNEKQTRKNKRGEREGCSQLPEILRTILLYSPDIHAYLPLLPTHTYAHPSCLLCCVCLTRSFSLRHFISAVLQLPFSFSCGFTSSCIGVGRDCVSAIASHHFRYVPERSWRPFLSP